MDANKPQLALNPRGPRGLSVGGDKKTYYGNEDFPPSSKVEMITDAAVSLLILIYKHIEWDDGDPTVFVLAKEKSMHF